MRVLLDDQNERNSRWITTEKRITLMNSDRLSTMDAQNKETQLLVATIFFGATHLKKSTNSYEYCEIAKKKLEKRRNNADCRCQLDDYKRKDEDHLISPS